MHLEFIVPGPPVSNQQSNPTGKANLTAWRATIAGAAAPLWAKAPLAGHLKVIIINFYAGNKPSLDLDNMSKPILDAMQGIVYDDDRQIVQAELTHSKIDAAYRVKDARPIIVTALQAGSQFVYVQIEDAVDPFPLPK